jgi:hypothetical protein
MMTMGTVDGKEEEAMTGLAAKQVCLSDQERKSSYSL